MLARRTVLGLALAGIGACHLGPRPPTVIPVSAQVVPAGLGGVTIHTVLLVRNPNSYAIATRSVSAHVIVAGQDLEVTAPVFAFTLAPRVNTAVTVDLPVRWGNVPGLAMAAMLSPSLPYHVEGTVTVDAHGVSFDAPFTLDGTMPRALLGM